MNGTWRPGSQRAIPTSKDSDLLRADYHRWHHLQVDTSDIDPTYPVYRHVIAEQSLTPDRAAWLMILHVAYYHVGSALRAFAALPDPAAPHPELLRLPCATERRGHRDDRQFTRHWLALLDVFDRAGGPDAWIRAGGTAWPALTTHLAAVHGNGRWAAYKLGEVAQKVLGVPTVITDAGHANSSGPRKGLGLLYNDLPAGNSPGEVAELDTLTQQLADELAEPDIGLVETSLCDYHSLTRGRYYLGHDIDAMQDQLYRVRSDFTPAVFRARAATLPHAYLGELAGWVTVDTARTRIYAATGDIVERHTTPTGVPRG